MVLSLIFYLICVKKLIDQLMHKEITIFSEQNSQMIQKFQQKKNNNEINKHQQNEYRCIVRSTLGGAVRSSSIFIKTAGELHCSGRKIHTMIKWKSQFIFLHRNSAEISRIATKYNCSRRRIGQIFMFNRQYSFIPQCLMGTQWQNVIQLQFKVSSIHHP